MSTPNEPTPSQAPIKAGSATAPSRGRVANWTVGAAAALLVLISVGGYFYHREQLTAIAADHLRLVVTGPSSLQTGVGAEYIVSTRTISDQAIPAQIEVALSAPDGKPLKAYKERADEHGRLRVAIPADLRLPPRTKLKVAAWHGQTREEAEMTLAVKPASYVTQLALDRPLYRPGETVYYRSLTLLRFGLIADQPTPVHFEILDPKRAVVPRSLMKVVADRGVGSGAFAIARDLPPGQYSLVARSPDRKFPEEKQPFSIRQYRLPLPKTESEPPPSPSPASTTSAKPGKIEVEFFPEGGELAVGLENRVYFVARDSRGKPLQLSGVIVAKGRGEGHEQEVAAVQTTFQGMGALSLTPQPDVTYRLKITSPTGVDDEPKLPEVSAQRDLVLTTGAGVFDAGKPLEFNVRAAKAGLPLVVAAYCRGVPVGQQVLVTKTNPTVVNPVVIPLDDAVGGVVRLSVYDYSVSPPTLAADRLVYRRPARRLNVAVTGLKERYAPGEKVDLSLSVTNEKGEPASAALSAMVIDEGLLRLAGDHPTAASTYFLLTDQIEKPRDLETADFVLSEQCKDNVPAAVALDLLLGTQAWRLTEASDQETGEESENKHLDRTAPTDDSCGPPAMFDNLSQIRSTYDKTVADYQADRTRAMNTLTTASFFGGLGLVLLVAMLGLMRIVSGIHLWAAAIGATTCCMIIGAILMDPGRLATGLNTAVAFATYLGPPSSTDHITAPQQFHETGNATPGKNESASTLPIRHYAHQHVAEQPGTPRDFAEALFWNPLLIAGPDGKASVSFDLSDAASTFHIMVDAHAEGRLGAGRAEIIVHDTP